MVIGACQPLKPGIKGQLINDLASWNFKKIAAKSAQLFLSIANWDLSVQCSTRWQPSQQKT